MVLKSLLVKSWKTVGKQMNLMPKEVISIFRNCMRKLWEHYGGKS
jgi:tRNA(Met) C34 N-acetyltransferase TmcA